MRKTTNHSKTEKNASKELSWYQKYKNLNSWKEHESSPAFFEKLGISLMEWSDKPDALKVTQFLRVRGISWTIFLQWIEKKPELKKAYEYALSNIGDRREIGALKREYSEKTVHFVQRHYCPIWREAERQQAELKKEEDKGSKPVVIEVKQFSSE